MDRFSKKSCSNDARCRRRKGKAREGVETGRHLAREKGKKDWNTSGEDREENGEVPNKVRKMDGSKGAPAWQNRW